MNATYFFKPTVELRYYGKGANPKVLQQKWEEYKEERGYGNKYEKHITGKEEWRKVPLVREK